MATMLTCVLLCCVVSCQGMLNDLSIGSEQSQAFEKFYKENPNITG